MFAKVAILSEMAATNAVIHSIIAITAALNPVPARGSYFWWYYCEPASRWWKRDCPSALAHGQQYHVKKGINFITVLYQNAFISLPANFISSLKPNPIWIAKRDQQRRRSPYSKNQPFRMTISLCVQNQLAFGCVLADSWYASAKNMRGVRLELKPDFIFPLKSNRQLALCRLALAELICSYVNHQLQNCNRMTDIYHLAIHVECHF